MTPDEPDDEESALLRADYLMRRHQRPNATPEGGVDAAAEEDFIPTLTDLVRLGYRTAVAPPPESARAAMPPAPAADPASPRDAAAGFSIPPALAPEPGLPDIFDPTLAPPSDEPGTGIDFVLDEPLPAIPDPADDPLALPIHPAPPLWVAPRMDALPQVDTPLAAPPAAVADQPGAPGPLPEAMERPAAADAMSVAPPASVDRPAPAAPAVAVPAPPLQTHPRHVRAILERRLRAELSELVDQALAEVSLELQARMGRILRETLDEAETDARADADPGHEAKPG